MITNRGVLVDPLNDWIDELIQKTDGIPQALSIFLILVEEYGRSPYDLLKGAFLNYDRLRIWFKEVLDNLEDLDIKLLYRLSVCEEPFNIGVVRVHRKELGVDLNTIDRAFSKLQNHHLLQRYNEYRWKVHHLVAKIIDNIFSVDNKEKIHLSLANYFIQGQSLKKFGNHIGR